MFFQVKKREKNLFFEHTIRLFARHGARLWHRFTLASVSQRREFREIQKRGRAVISAPPASKYCMIIVDCTLRSVSCRRDSKTAHTTHWIRVPKMQTAKN